MIRFKFFETHNISRKEMPQIRDDQEFIQFLKSEKISHSDVVDVKSKYLKMVQDKIDKEKMSKIDGKNIRPVIVSNDMHIIDGHHRWAAAVKSGRKHVPAVIIDRNMLDSLKIAKDFENK